MANGTVKGIGNILNGNIEEITNAIKAVVTKEKIIILTEEGKIYEYVGGNITEKTIPEKVIDISAKENTVILQTEEENIYISGTKVAVHGENAFGMGAGNFNTYIIENTGAVYANGSNEYGSIGNSTRTSETEHTKVRRQRV